MFSVSEKNIYWAVNWNNWMFLQVFDREISEDFNLQYYLYCFVHEMKINLCKPLKSININSRVRYFSDYIWLMAELWMSISQKIRTIICQAPININKEMYISEYMDYLSIKMSWSVQPFCTHNILSQNFSLEDQNELLIAHLVLFMYNVN